MFYPIYFEGITATELQDSFVCTCKDNCAGDCSCGNCNLPCIKHLCGCEGDCNNPVQDLDAEDEKYNDQEGQ